MIKALKYFNERIELRLDRELRLAFIPIRLNCDWERLSIFFFENVEIGFFRGKFQIVSIMD